MGLSCEKSEKQELSSQRSPDRARELVTILSDFHTHLLKKEKKSLDFLSSLTLEGHSLKLNLSMRQEIAWYDHFCGLFQNRLEFLT